MVSLGYFDVFLTIKINNQGQEPRDMGVGLVASDGNDESPGILKRGEEWNFKELLDSGAVDFLTTFE
jgi:hypothetical protein